MATAYDPSQGPDTDATSTEDEDSPLLKKATGLGLDVDAPSDAPPTDQETATIKARVDAMKAAAGTPVDEQKYADAQAEARQLYQDKASRAEWMGLADRIGAAATKFAAAAAGQKAHVDLSHIDTGPGYDATGAIDRASKDYSTSLGQIQADHKDALQNQQANYGMAERAMGDITQAKRWQKSEDNTDKRLAHADQMQARSQANQADRDDKRYANEGAIRSQMAADADQRQQNALTQKDKFEGDREDRRARDADVKDLDGQVKSAAIKYQARQQLYNNLMNDDGISSKDDSKLAATYGKQAAAAGVDLSDIKSQLSGQETTRPGWLVGKTSEEERAGKQAILQQSLTEAKNLLDALQAKKAARLAARQQPAAPVQSDDDGSGTAPAADAHPDKTQNGWLYRWDGQQYKPVSKA